MKDVQKSRYLLSDTEVVELRRRLKSWGNDNFRQYPWRTTDNPFEGLIAEILLQRTRVQAVRPVYDRFISRFPDADSLAEASLTEIEKVIYPLGLRWRAPLLKRLGRQLSNMSSFPQTEKELITLPCVGSYTAAAWVSFHGNGRGALIDSNVVRWICRLMGIKHDGETRRAKWLIEVVERITPNSDVRLFNYALLDFTMGTCSVHNPDCWSCLFALDLCSFHTIATVVDD